MDMESALKAYHRTRIARAAENFGRRAFATHLFETASEAADFFFSSISPSDSVGHGGSETLRQLGILARLRGGGYTFLDRHAFGHTYDEQLEIRRKNLSTDAFVASSNAASMDGALVNIDGDGNRVSALGFGPRRVFLFIGRNKLTHDLESAIHRARNVASVALATQLGKNTPCVKTGVCQDCASPERICNNLSIIERCNPPGRITLLFINEDFGL